MGHSGLWGKKRGVIQIENGWKLLRNPQKLGINPIGDHYELYNVLDDPSETTNVKDDFPEIFEDMKTQVERLLEDIWEQFKIIIWAIMITQARFI